MGEEGGGAGEVERVGGGEGEVEEGEAEGAGVGAWEEVSWWAGVLR